MRNYKTNQQRQMAQAFKDLGITRDGAFPKLPIKRTKHGEFALLQVHTDALTDEQEDGLREKLAGVGISNHPASGFAIIIY